MSVPVSALELFRSLIPGVLWLAIIQLGPWPPPTGLVVMRQNPSGIDIAGFLVVAYVLGRLSTALAFEILPKITNRFTFDFRSPFVRLPLFRLQWPVGLVRRSPLDINDSVKIPLLHKSPGLAQEAQRREAEVNSIAALFLPAVATVLTILSTFIRRWTDGWTEFDWWASLLSLGALAVVFYCIESFSRDRYWERDFLERANDFISRSRNL